MSSNEELWDQLTQRVVHSQVGGVTSEDDDVLASADILEALINPHRGAQGGAGMNGPGMMPPMMMGGMGGGAGGSGSAGVSAGPSQVRQGPIATGTQRPAPAGVPGEAREVERVSGPGGGGAVSSRPSSGGGAPPGPSEAPPAAEAGGPPAPVVGQASEVSGAASWITVASGEAPAGPSDGFSVDPTVVRALGERWTAWSEQMGALTPHPDASMGLFEQAQQPHQALTQHLNAWRRGAVDEFDAIGARLHRTAARYEAVDDVNVAGVRHTGGLDA